MRQSLWVVSAFAILVAACGSEASIQPAPHTPAPVPSADTELSVVVTDTDQGRVSCEGQRPRRITVQLDGRSLGTQSIPCIERFVSPPPATTFTSPAAIGAHTLIVMDESRKTDARRTIELVAPDPSLHFDSGVSVQVDVSNKGIVISAPQRGIMGAM